MPEHHVSPINDLIIHDLEGDGCICGPDFGFVPGGILVIHHSLDGREQAEQTGGDDGDG